jgi:predicted transposase/invertase (TIGR01784 family)
MIGAPLMASSPHDALFKESFGQPDLARSELELVLPAEVQVHIDLSTLVVSPGSFVDPEYRQVHSDLLYAVRTKGGEEALVYILFEHQSSYDATMPFRLLRYIVRVWERWLRHHKGTKTLPVVLPVVLHHGEGAWKAAPELATMFDATPEFLDATRPFLPHFRFVLDDISALSVGVLASRPLAALPRLVLLALWASRSFSRLRDATPFMRAVVATLVRDEPTRALLTQLFLYVLSTAPSDVDVREIRTILLEVAGPEGEEDVMNVMNAAAHLIEHGRAEGERRGEQRGLRAAIAAALSARGLPISEVGRARVASCVDVETLTQWLSRAVTAGSEAEIFGGSDEA